MKILLASMPADGHFNPLTGIAVQLTGRGHDVRWYAGPTYGARLDRLGMPWFAYERATEVMASNLNQLFPERATLKGPKLISFELPVVRSDRSHREEAPSGHGDCTSLARAYHARRPLLSGRCDACPTVGDRRE